jgi:hypothetical protein
MMSQISRKQMSPDSTKSILFNAEMAAKAIDALAERNLGLEIYEWAETTHTSWHRCKKMKN